MLKRIFIFATLLALFTTVTIPASAIAPVDVRTKNRGLYLSPVRSYLTLKAGDTVTRSFTIANLTDAPMTVTTDVKQFSVADYSYDFSFQSTADDWVKLTEQTVTLKPYESHDIAYRLAVPTTAAPGGHYYTLYASSTTPNGVSTSTIQATNLLYLTVDGQLTHGMQVVGQSLPQIVVAPEIRYTLDVKNTGNIHYFTYHTTKLEGIFYSNAPNGTSQLLMPGTTRQLTGAIRAPVVPGVYALTYTLTPDKGASVSDTRYIFYAPPWFIILCVFALALLAHHLVRRYGRRTPNQP